MKKIISLLTLVLLIALCLSSCSLFVKDNGTTDPDDSDTSTPGNSDTSTPGGDEEEAPCTHSWVTDSAIAPTCTESGLTEGKHCSLCGEVETKQETVNPLGHTEVIDEAKAASCTEDGLKAGVHCSVCDAVIIAQEVIPAAHTYGEWEDITVADCFFDGEQKRVCSVCDESDTQKIEKLEHKFAQNEETGLFACEECDARILNGHLYAAFDITYSWFDAYKACNNLGGHLVTITSATEQAVITDMMNVANQSIYWMGGLLNTDGWQWITGEKFEYTNWRMKQPDFKNENEWYMNIYASPSNVTVGEWNDLDANHTNHSSSYTDANSKVGFICEWELDIAESDHYFTEWKVTSEATCFTDGEQYRICTHCGLEETEVLTQLEHSFIFNDATGITSCEHCGAATYDGRIYKVFMVSHSWFDAYSYCDELGGHLVTITSEEEQTFIESYMNSISYSNEAWIGAYSDGEKWQWVTDEEFDYTNWSAGEPNCSSGKEFFTEINNINYGEWNDLPPLRSLNLICEWEVTE